MPESEPEGLWLVHIHHMGELEKSSSVVAPREWALRSMDRWDASTDQSQLGEVGEVLVQSSQ